MNKRNQAPKGVHPEALGDTPPQTTASTALHAATRALNEIVSSGFANGAPRLDAVLKAVDVALNEHRDLSEMEGGSFDDIALRRPAIVPRLDQQREEHASLIHRTGHVQTVLERAEEFDDVDPERMCLEARILHDLIRLHLTLETELLQEAYQQVEGGEDGG
jgi:hypothetical protein